MAKMVKSDKTHMQIHTKQLKRLKRIAKDEERTMLVMIKLLIDKWENDKAVVE